MYLLEALKISNKVRRQTWESWEYVVYDDSNIWDPFTHVNGNKLALPAFNIMIDNWEPYVDTGASDTPIPRKIVSLFHCPIDNSVRYYEYNTLEELKTHRDKYKKTFYLVMAIWVDKINLIDTMIWEEPSK